MEPTRRWGTKLPPPAQRRHSRALLCNRIRPRQGRVSYPLYMSRSSDTTKDTDQTPSRTELLWREYQMGVDLYKFYVDLVIKVIVSYYAITGAILSFYFTKTGVPVARWALALPCLMSFGLAVLFRWGAGLWQIVRDNTFDLAAELDLSSVFELRALSILLNCSAILLVGTGGAMVAIIVI